MAAICLSPVLGIRCLGLSHVQEGVSLLPIGLEVVFSLGLTFAGRDAGRIRFLLAAEGPVFLFLAVLSFLGHAIPVFQNNLAAFEGLDIVIGIMSLVPVLLYTSFLYLFNQREFFPRLPMRFMRVAKVFLLAVIPIIVLTSEIGSFIGIRYRNPGVNPSVSFQPGGPGYGAHEFERVLLSSTSLALLAVAQALAFLLSFLALVTGLVKQRSIEDRAATEREGVLFRGLGWLTVGTKLSMLETVLGWVNPSFDVILLRRGLRMIGRACIIIGVVKGPERREEFVILDNENGRAFLSGTRKLTVTGLRLQISSPTLIESSMSYRLSRMTLLRPFAQSEPVSEQILSASRRVSAVPSLGPSTRTSILGTKARPPPLTISRSSEDNHVTVIQTIGRAPTLVLRLSSTGLPSGDTIAAMSEKLLRVPVSANVPLPLSRAAPSTAPLTAPLPRTDLRPPENFARTSGGDGGRRRSSNFSVLNRRSVTSPMASAVDSEAMLSRGSSRSVPSSPRVPHAFPLPPASILRVPQRAPASEVRVPAPRSSMRTRPDRHAREISTASGLSTEWISTEDSSIKGIGTVRPRITPNPTRELSVRASIVLERHGEIAEPPPAPPPPEPGANLVRKDSGVLGKDDLVRMRRTKSVY